MKYNLKNRPTIAIGTVLTVEVMENYISESLRHDNGFKAELRDLLKINYHSIPIKEILGEQVMEFNLKTLKEAAKGQASGTLWQQIKGFEAALREIIKQHEDGWYWSVDILIKEILGE